MTDNSSIPPAQAKKLHEWMKTQGPEMCEFARLVANRLPGNVIPVQFIMICEMVLYELKRGRMIFGSKIDSILAWREQSVYHSLKTKIAEIAEAIFSKQFAEAVAAELKAEEQAEK